MVSDSDTRRLTLSGFDVDSTGTVGCQGEDRFLPFEYIAPASDGDRGGADLAKPVIRPRPVAVRVDGSDAQGPDAGELAGINNVRCARASGRDETVTGNTRGACDLIPGDGRAAGGGGRGPMQLHRAMAVGDREAGWAPGTPLWAAAGAASSKKASAASNAATTGRCERPPERLRQRGDGAGAEAVARASAPDALSARLGSARLGSARLGSARLGSARLGSARLGSARLGSARLGSARLIIVASKRSTNVKPFSTAAPQRPIINCSPSLMLSAALYPPPVRHASPVCVFPPPSGAE